MPLANSRIVGNPEVICPGSGFVMGSRLVGSVGCVALPVFCLVSLVSALGRNWCYSCGTVEGVETGETVEIATVHAGFMHVAENMVGWQKRLGEYPTLSATFLRRNKRVS